jgi:capsid protein
MARRPVNRGRLGRQVRREGASAQGHLTSWTDALVNQIMAEREKHRVSNRALDLYTNDAMAHGLLESLVVEAVGIGVTPHPSPDFEALGRDRKWADTYRRQALRGWNRWGLDCRNFCDATSRLNIYGLQQLAYFMWKLDGVGLFQIVWRDRPFAPSPIAILPIDPGRLVTPADRPGEPIYDGIKIDTYGSPKSIFLVRPEKYSTCATGYAPASACQEIDVVDQATGLPRVLMVTGVRGVSEYRQDSLLGPVITELRDNKDFVGAALVRSLISNLFVMFIENAQAQARTDITQRIIEMDKGTILQGGNREIPHFFENRAAPDGYDTMFNSIIRRLGMATARGSENVTREYKSSYSASKASLAQSAQVNAVDLMTINNRFNQPVMSWLQYEQGVAGRLDTKTPDHMLEYLYEYTTCQWLPQPQAEIDRQKAANANKIALGTGELTQSDIHGAQGNDWRVKRRQRAEELAYDRELENEFGLAQGAMSDSTGVVMDPADNGDDDD